MSDELAALILEEVKALRAEVGELRAGAARQIPDRPMTPKEFGVIVGKCEKTVRNWIAAGKLKAKHVGRTMLISPSNARRFLDPREEFEG